MNNKIVIAAFLNFGLAFGTAKAQVIFDIDAAMFSASRGIAATSYNNHSSVRNVYWGLSTNLSKCAFDDVVVRDPAGSVVFRDNFSSKKVEWNYQGGDWGIANGRLVQSDLKSNGEAEICYVQTGEDCTIEFSAIKESGTNGIVFLLSFTDKDNFVRWNVGCDNNTMSRVERSTDGNLSTIASRELSLQANRSYSMKAQMSGEDVALSIDGVIVHRLPLTGNPLLSATASASDDGKSIDVVIDNPTGIQQNVTLRLHNAEIESAVTVVDDIYGHTEYPISIIDGTGVNTAIASSGSTTIRLLLTSPIVTSVEQVHPSARDRHDSDGLYDLSGQRVGSVRKGMIVIKKGVKYMIR